MDVFKFALDKDSLTESIIEKRIDLLLKSKSEGKEVTQLYKPRESGVNKNAYRFKDH